MIARDSTSYPFLAIAQHRGAGYGDVLVLADLHERKAAGRYPGRTIYDAVARTPLMVKVDVARASVDEAERRRVVLSTKTE